MRKFFCSLLVLVLLTGCSGVQEELDEAMELRARMIAGNISFRAEITADYGDESYVFTMDCTADTAGKLSFTVVEPEGISGVTGSVSGSGGKLTFGDTALAFELMADGQFSPVSAPWILIKTLRSGYLTSCTQEGELLRLSIDDSYADDALHLDIWLKDDAPVLAEIYWQGRRLLTLEVENFVIS